MTGRQCVAWRGLCSVGLVWLAACTKERAPHAESWSNVCIDVDVDGYGFQCERGEDCDDQDPALHDSCARCSSPEQGCVCENQAPVDCRLPYELHPSGALLCRDGTRYCRDGRWTGCEGVASYLVPAEEATLRGRALVDADAGPAICDPCNPDCFRVDDPLVTPPGYDLGPEVVPAAGGGITLAPLVPGGGPLLDMLIDEAPCAPDDGDCDGLPDAFDPQPAVATPGYGHRTIFLDLPPGASATRRFQSDVQVNRADVYFYLDATSFMEGVRDRLIAELSTGNFLPDAGSGIDCADSDGDGAPNEELKTAGITGNLRCLFGDAQFGAGWFRDIPFTGPFAATGEMVAPWDYEPFEHRQDISADVASLQTALAGFATRANLNVPEGGMQGLWALATGAELYAGWDRAGIPARRGCPAGSWGYPCFRDGSVPIIVQFTDAPMHNGPATPEQPATSPATPANCLSDAVETSPGVVACTPLEYDADVLGDLRAGSEGTYRALSGPAESFTSAEQVGTIDGVLITYAGNTERMQADVVYDAALFVSCPSLNAWSTLNEGSPDAVFRFHVDTLGTYLVSARGSRFDTSLMLLRTDASGTPTAPIACSDDSVWLADSPGQRGDTAELEEPLAPGDYAVVLKGYRSAARGLFQISFGRRASERPGAFEAQRWLGPAGDGAAGVRRALNDRSIQVVTLRSSGDWYAAQQAQLLASATDAVAADGAPLSVAIDPSGAGVGTALVQALGELGQGLSSDVSLTLVQAPDDPSPDFELRVEAVDESGDGCEPPVDRDGDPAQLPDTHVQCRAGATPRFQVTFRNPSGAGAVPLNPSDPAGGYHMLLHVVGDGGVVLDRVPVYIVPTDVIPDPPPETHIPAGSYQQEVPISGCADTEGASWRTLYWNALLPEGTRVVFEMCSGDSDQELADCTFQQVVELVPGAPCNVQTDCGETGYCDVSGFCHQVIGAPCTLDEECGVFDVCSNGAVCSPSRAAIDLRATALASLQGRRRAIVRIELYADAAGTQAPTIRDWRVDYACAARE